MNAGLTETLTNTLVQSTLLEYYSANPTPAFCGKSPESRSDDR